MQQLTEKTADEKSNWIAARTIGERATIVWFDRDRPLGVTWTGTIMSVDETVQEGHDSVQGESHSPSAVPSDGSEDPQDGVPVPSRDDH